MTSTVKRIPISENFRLILDPKKRSSLTPHMQSRIDDIWSQASKITDWDLFDGKIFQMTELYTDHMVGNFNDYRTFYAQCVDRELKKKLGMTIVGVSSILVSDAQCLLGKRSSRPTQFPLHWEFAPSGGVSIDFATEEEVDYQKQIFEELTEEVGMDPDFVTKITPFVLLWDQEDNVIDLCMKLEVDPLGKEAASYLSDEYIAYEWLPLEKVPHFFQNRDVVPASKSLFDCLSKI